MRATADHVTEIEIQLLPDDIQRLVLGYDLERHIVGHHDTVVKIFIVKPEIKAKDAVALERDYCLT